MTVKRLLIVMLVLILVIATINIIEFVANNRDQSIIEFGYNYRYNNVIGFGNLYCISSNTLYCFDPSTGIEYWKFKANKDIYSLTLYDNKLYFNADDKIYCLDAQTGKTIWDNFSSNNISSVSNGKIYTYYFDYHFVGLIEKGLETCFDAQTGSKLWEHSVLAGNSITTGDKTIYYRNTVDIFASYFYDSTDPTKEPQKVVNEPNKLFCVDSQSRFLIWEQEYDGSFCEPQFINDNMYTYLYPLYNRSGNEDISLLCFDVNSGIKRWKYQYTSTISVVERHIYETPTISNGRIYVKTKIANENNSISYSLLCVGALKGNLLWNYKIQGELNEDINFNKNLIFVSSTIESKDNMSNKPICTCLDALTGEEIWKKEFIGIYTRDTITSSIISNDKIYINVGVNRSLTCLDSLTGEELWQHYSPDSYYTQVILNDHVYIGSIRFLYCLDASTGKKLWQYDILGTTFDSPVVSDGKVFVSTEDEDLLCLEERNGKKLWEFKRDDQK